MMPVLLINVPSANGDIMSWSSLPTIDETNNRRAIGTLALRCRHLYHRRCTYIRHRGTAYNFYLIAQIILACGYSVNVCCRVIALVKNIQ